jgi:hypothetical protein
VVRAALPVAGIAFLVSLVSGPPAAEPAAQWVVPRTPWGDPDLEGVWPSTDALGIPLERSPHLGTRNTLTDEEFAVRVALAQQQQQFCGGMRHTYEYACHEGNDAMRNILSAASIER